MSAPASWSPFGAGGAVPTVPQPRPQQAPLRVAPPTPRGWYPHDVVGGISRSIGWPIHSDSYEVFWDWGLPRWSLEYLCARVEARLGLQA
eukprot:11109775-Alexandrium_andersonii.AAC.1